MDICHLDDDEVNVELEVRNLDASKVTSLDDLKRMLADEATGVRGKPAGPHRLKSTNVELQLLNRKSLKCMGDYETAKREGDRDRFSVLYSKVLHLLGRFERLKEIARNLKVSESMVQVESLLEKIIAENVRNSPDSSPTCFAGFTASDLISTECEGAVGFTNENPIVSTAASREQLQIDQQSLPSTVPLPTGSEPVYRFPTTNSSAASFRTNLTRTNITEASGNIFGSRHVSQLPAARVTWSSMTADPFSFNVPQSSSATTNRNPTVPSNLSSLGHNQGMNHWESHPAVENEQINPDRNENHRSRQGLSQTLSRWSIRFGGLKKDLPIDEFFFRVENLAAADNITADSLVLGLHSLLVDSAADFYWVHRRKNPNATWNQLKTSLLAHFSKQENDFELRKTIMSRRQGIREEFGEFCLVIECMAARLTRQMDDAEILEIIRQNMSPRLQDRLLMLPIPSLDFLKSTCQRYERMWSRHSNVSTDGRFSGRMAELGFNAPNNVGEVADSFQHMDISTDRGVDPVPFEFEVAEINRNAGPRPSPEYVICWNCDDIGHTFVDCQSPVRNVFCYGCGAKNTYRPKCSKCSSGNMQRGGNNQSRFRPNASPSNRNTNSNPFSSNRTPNAYNGNQ